MRIGIDAHMLGDKSGGNESFYAGILSSMNTNDGNEYILFVRSGVDIAKYIGKFQVVFFKSRNAAIRNFVELSYLCVKYKLDVLHTQYYLPFIRPCKTVCTIHDISYEHYKDIFNKSEYFRNKLLIPYAACRADKVITVSNFCKKDISTTYRIPENKIEVIYNAVDPEFRVLTDEERQCANVRDTYGIGDEQYLLCVGNLQPRKNIPRLIRAFELYKKKTGANTKLVIVGKKAWLYKEILEEASNDKDIVLTGYVPKCDLVDLLNEAKGFVYPSYFEGFGIPPLEALSCGTPVAVSDIDVMREVLGDVVIYFDPYDEKDIASALKRLITEDKISQIKRIDIHTWGQSAEQLKKVYMKTNNGG